MKTSDFWYDLPRRCIAQSPAERRDHSRLMRLDRRTGLTQQLSFFQLPGLLRPGDCLVLNNTRVLPARLIGRRGSGGQAELLLLRDLGEDVWECLAKPGKRIGAGCALDFGDGLLRGSVTAVKPDGLRDIHFEYEGVFLEVLERLGRAPLPPYISERLDDDARYQTIYAKSPGSAAAPTAGLHFTKELLEELSAGGVLVRELTLHIGLGTFRPVQAERIEEHHMHSELCMLPEDTAQAVRETKRRGGRVIAVGTTVCRTLESRVDDQGDVQAGSGWTDIFISPGFTFRAIDGLITNFHLPESTLLMLVSAFAGREHVLRAYEEAVRDGYRFFSFGDAMAIL